MAPKRRNHVDDKFCFLCYMLESFSPARFSDPDFITERKNEFYPQEDWGDYVPLCPLHAFEMEYLLREAENQ